LHNQWNVLGSLILLTACIIIVIGLYNARQAYNKRQNEEISLEESNAGKLVGRILLSVGVILAILSSILFYQPMIEIDDNDVKKEHNKKDQN
jgi:hypothetical protein